MTSNTEAIANYLSLHFDTDSQDGNFAPYILRILSALGWKGDAKTIQEALPHHETKSVLNLTDFLNTMAKLGYSPQIININKNELSENMLPCLFLPIKGAMTSAEVLLSPTKENEKGRAFIFEESYEKADIIQDKTITSSDKGWFTKLLYRFKDVFKQVLLASFFINILALVTPIFMMSVYDKVLGAHSEETLKYLIFGVVIAIGVEFLLRTLRSKSLAWFGARIDYIVSSSILDKLMSLPASYTERASVAAQLSRLKAFESVREFFTGTLFLSFVELPFTLILLGAIALIAGNLVLIPITIAFCYVILLISMNNTLKAKTMRLSNASGERQKINIETLGKQETLRTSGAIDAWLDRYQKTSAEASYASYLYSQSVNFIDTISQSLFTLGGITMIYFGVEKIWAEEMSIGAMIAILILTWRTLAPLQMACTAIPRLDHVKRNIIQINRLMDLSAERDTSHVSQTTPEIKGDIEFHNVGLRYSKDTDPVFAGLSFKIKPGQHLAIVGSNSTGKSTILKLVSGLYHPQAGSIRIDGVDIRQIDVMKLRQNIAYISQEPEFFTMSVEDNLRMVRPDASDNDIQAAIRDTGLTEWVDDLPDGVKTVIGHGAKIDVPSAIRPQLNLARAYLQNSPIMLIDEMPYEFLNTEAGKHFYEFLKSQKGKRTILYISYRQDYIDLADLSVHLYDDDRPQVKEATNE